MHVGKKHQLALAQMHLADSLMRQVRSLYVVGHSRVDMCPILEKYIDRPNVIKPVIGGVIGRPATPVQEIEVLPDIHLSTLKVVRVYGVTVSKFIDSQSSLILGDTGGRPSKSLTLTVDH